MPGPPAWGSGTRCGCGAAFPPTMLGAWEAKLHAEGCGHRLRAMPSARGEVLRRRGHGAQGDARQASAWG